MAEDVEKAAGGNNIRATRRHLVNVTVAAGTSLRAAMDVIVAYIPGVTRSGSQPVGPSLSSGFTASAWRADEALDYLTKDTGYLWRIDNANVLSMWAPGTLTAPFNVIDGDGHTDGDVEVEPQRAEFATKVIVLAAGGTIVGTATDASYASNPWELVVESPDTKTQVDADALAASVLAASLVQWKEVRYQTLQTGLEPGMSQTITLAARGINNTYLVTEVNTEIRGAVAMRRVRATEGVVYKTGWREQARSLFSGGSSSARSLAGVVGGGLSSVRSFVFLGGSASDYVQDPTPTWVDASPMTVTIDTVPRGTTSADVTVTMRALDAGVTVQARLYDVTAGAPCPGTSAVVTSTTWTTVTFTATLTAGSHRYKLQLLPGAANADVGAIGHLL
jgi:hypothetical protein